ncbi:MAG: glutamate-5-semialdehyde dehydrogenase [Pseudomonadota bacterium]
MSIKKLAQIIAKNTQIASLEIANLSTDLKNKILLQVAQNIRANKAQIIAANQNDVALAQQNNFDKAKIDRLILDEKRIENLADAVVDIARLEDPIGKILYDVKRSNGLHIRRISVPIGVILAIYESRPNVTSDIAALGFKAGNAVILRAGKESSQTSGKIAEIYQNTLREFGVNPACVSYVQSTDRDYVKELLKLDKFIDVVIPRGGKDLIKAIIKSTRIPMFKHLDGNCHTYIETSADLQKALKIIANAKMRRVGVCGATESLLIDQKIAKEFLPKIIDELSKFGCQIRGDQASQKIDHRVLKASDKDFYTEYLDAILSVKIVKNIEAAINHINKYSSSHTESIVCENQQPAEKFFQKINSAIVMHNASTQFADGGEFGMGGEVGISTGKLHARGPVGLEQLTIYKYIVEADCGLRS